MSTLDAVLLHVPRFDGERRRIMVMPAGLPALANLLADEGYRVEVVHLGIEQEAEEGFSLARYLMTRRPRLVLLSLHWSAQTRPVVDLSERIHGLLPESRIFLGGLTASVFAVDIVRSLPFIDGVVRGDGEGPLSALARVVVRGEGKLGGVPNLVHRDRRGVRRNEWSWALDADSSARLRHGSLALLRHRQAYVDRALYADFSPSARTGPVGYPGAAYLNAGRGCTRACLCCGGAASGQRLTSARDGVLLYPLDKLLRDARDAYGEGARTLRTSFDPAGSRRRVCAWLRRMDGEGLRMRVIYDLWSLPSPALLETLSTACAPGSMVVYSPECGSERVRRLVRPRSFSNGRLLESIAAAEARGLETHVFFSAGLPGETPAEVDDTARLVERIRARTGAGVSVTPMAVDPASPLWADPDRYGVHLLRRSLGDFYDERGLPGGPGYETEHFDEVGIVRAVARLLEVARGAPGAASAPGVPS